MRRTVALVAGVCAAVAVAGVAGGAAYPTASREPAPAATGRPPAEPTPETSPERAAASRPVRTSPPPTQQPGAVAEQVRRERIGAVDQTVRTLGYLDQRRALVLRYPGAAYVKPHLNRLRLLPGDYLTVSNPAGTEVYRIDRNPLSGSGGQWAMSISGDTAVVELHPDGRSVLTRDTTVAAPGIMVDKVAYGLPPAKRATESSPAEQAAAGPGREESTCGSDEQADAVCYKSSDPVAYRRSKAVARLLINGTELCTAWRVGPTNRMLSNNHCLITSDDAYNTEVWFNYQCAQCGGQAVFRPTKVWGATVLSTDRTLDYTLFTVDDFAAVEKFGYLQLDLRRPARGEEMYIPQHPGGDPTTIATASDQDSNGTCAVDNPAFTGYATASDISYRCDTQGGSSGSPVISRSTHKVIALHHLGGCPNSGVRIDLIYNRIKAQL